MPTSDPLNSNESNLSEAFYEAAINLRKDTFEQLTKRILGSRGFGKYAHPKELERECRKMFELARTTPGSGA